MENYDVVHQSLNCLLIFEEKVFHLLRLVYVKSTLNMATLKFIVKAAINYQMLPSMSLLVIQKRSKSVWGNGVLS